MPGNPNQCTVSASSSNEENGKGTPALTGQMLELDNLIKDGRTAQL